MSDGTAHERRRRLEQGRQALKHAVKTGTLRKGGLDFTPTSPEDLDDLELSAHQYSRSRKRGQTLIPITIRMKPETLEALRLEADNRGFRGYQTLLRSWIEERVSGVQPTLVERLKELMALIESAALAPNPVEVGQIMKAKVILTTPSRAEVVVNTTLSGSVDLSELTDKPVKSVEDIVTVGDEIVVKALAGVEEPHGLTLSRQQALAQLTAEGKPVEESISSGRD